MNELLPVALLVFLAAAIGVQLWKTPAAKQIALVVAITGSVVSGGLLSGWVSELVMPLVQASGVTMLQRVPILTIAASLAILWPVTSLLARLWLKRFPARPAARRGSAVVLGLIATVTAFAFVVGHLPDSLGPVLHESTTTRVVSIAARPVLDTLDAVGAGGVGVTGLVGGAPQVVLDTAKERAAEASVTQISVVADTLTGPVALNGSGWYLAPHLVATAAHVVAGGTTFTTAAQGGAPAAAELVYFDALGDIAILRTDAVGTPLPIADTVARGERGVGAGYPHITVGTPFTRLGYTFNQTRTITDMAITGGTSGKRLISTFQGIAYHGESGAAVINADGEVIGQVAQAINGQQMMIAVPVATIRTALAAVAGDTDALPTVDSQQSVLDAQAPVLG